MNRLTMAVLIAGTCLVSSLVSSEIAAEVLITVQEAKLPAAAGAVAATARGITRGPKVLLVSPSAGAGQKAPLDFKVKFETFGGSKIDTDAVKVTYLKSPLVDLTKRVSDHLDEEGIDFSAARIPPGDHVIRVDVKDTDGRTGTGSFTLKVLK